MITGFGWLVHTWLTPSEPRYQGRRVSDWFKQYYRSGSFGQWEEIKRTEAIVAIRAMGTNALPFLLDECFAVRRDPGCTNLLKALALLPKPVRLPFVPADEIRYEAAEAIGVIRPPASVLRPRLTSALASTNSEARWMAGHLLGYVGEGGETVVPILVGSLRARTPGERGLAAQSLVRLGKAARPALPALIEIVGNLTNMVVPNLCRTLGNLGDAATEALPVLRRRWEWETDPSAKRHLAVAMCRIAKPEPEVLNSIMMQLSDARHCYGAIRALGEIGPNAKAAIPALQELSAGTNRYRHQAATALRQIEVAAEVTDSAPER